MIQLCMLLGGDYNEGIRHIGLVSAMEILHAFGNKDDALVKFKDFIEGGDMPSEPVMEEVRR